MKTTKVPLGNINGKNIYAIGPYAKDIADIVMSQARQIAKLKAELKERDSDEGMRDYDEA